MNESSTVREWLREHGYRKEARMIDEILAEFEQAGSKTRRNWWDVLAGTRAGRPCVVHGRKFRVLLAARKRKGWPATPNSIFHDPVEMPLPIKAQVRWE